MSRSHERAIRRELGLTTRLWYWRGLKVLATELGWGEEACQVVMGSYPPVDWTRNLTEGHSHLGWLMATNKRLVFTDLEGERRLSVPLSSIHAVDARPVADSAILAIETEDESLEIGVHSDWPKRTAKTALAAFENHLRQSLETQQ